MIKNLIIMGLKGLPKIFKCVENLVKIQIIKI